MILSSFSYKTSNWALQDMDALKMTNLIVGLNASGKTRTINALKNVTSFLQMKPMLVFLESDFRAKLEFSLADDGSNGMVYEFEVENDTIIYEYLSVADKILLRRDVDSTVLKDDVINPPKDKLVVQVRRDSEAYPEIEELMKWAESVVVVSCSNLNPFTVVANGAGLINPISFSDLVDNLTSEDIETVITAAKTLGYNISEIASNQIVPDVKFVSVKEENIENSIVDFKLSSGMLRVLYLLCFLTNMRHNNRYSLLLIDDLGEGLDYRRSTLLGKMVFDACERDGVQLIGTSNDSFLMDVVNTTRWQILRRQGSKVSVLNDSNAHELFLQFSMTGLSNFDLISSDFIDNYLVSAGK